MKKIFFITGTDTGIGKTVVSAVLGRLLKEKGLSVGYFKPVQCAGDDAQFVKKFLRLSDSLRDINPYYAKEPLSPHLAFKREKRQIKPAVILDQFNFLKEKYDVLLVEGAGGAFVPLTDDYQVADLIQDFDAEVIVVSRLGLGTINHTLLTVQGLRDRGIRVSGIVFSESKKSKKGIVEKTNPKEIAKIGKVKVLGTLPYLPKLNSTNISKKCRIDIDYLFKASENRTNQLQDDDKKYLWHPFTQMGDWLGEHPLVIDNARGSYLIDSEGNKYLDGVSSLWVNVHGHRKREIDRAVKDQINKVSHSTILGLSNTPAVELAKKLIEIAPNGLEKVFYSDNGSTAVEIGIKMAYQYWQNIGRKEKRHIVHLENSYHGDTLGSVSVGGIDLFHKVYKHLTFPTIQVDLNNFEQVIKARHKEIAALVVEPLIQGAAGMIVWPKGVLKKMSQLCRKHDVIIIADEVATGFGRTGKMFACEHEGVSPDILCLAKGLTGGYLPLAATLTSKKIFDGFVFDYKDMKTFFHGHTYSGNPLACAAALANLEVFEKEQTLAKLQPKIKFLAKKLKMFYNLSHVGEVRQLGFMVGIELMKDPRSKEPFPFEEKIGVKVCMKVRDRGVILRPLGNVIVLMPPLSMSVKELEKLLDVTYWAIKKVTK